MFAFTFDICIKLLLTTYLLKSTAYGSIGSAARSVDRADRSIAHNKYTL